MKSYSKQIRQQILGAGFWSGIAFGAVFSLLVVVAIIYFHGRLNWVAVLITIGCIFVFALLLSLLRALKANRAIQKRLHSLESTTGKDIDTETFIPVSRDLSVGSQWLVYHHGQKYMFWTKPILESIHAENKAFGDKATVTIKTRGVDESESLAVKQGDNLKAVINSWLQQQSEDDVN